MTIPAVNLGDDDGFADVTIGGKTVRLDVARTHAKLFALQEQAQRDDRHGDGKVPFYDQAAKFLVELGFPEVSHGMMLPFVNWVNTRMAEVFPAAPRSRPAAAPPAAGEAPTPAEPRPEQVVAEEAAQA